VAASVSPISREVNKMGGNEIADNSGGPGGLTPAVRPVSFDVGSVDRHQQRSQDLMAHERSSVQESRMYVLVGADPNATNIEHPGGQITASIGLASFLVSQGFRCEVVDTTQSSFPIPGLGTRIRKGAKRLVQVIRLLRKNPVRGVVIFASAGWSFYEKVLISGICRLFRVPDLFFVRSGHFLAQVQSSIWRRLLVSALLRVPARIAAQGENWKDFYRSLGVRRERILLVRNWVPPSVGIVTEAKAAPSDSPLQFVFVGWLVRQKGVLECLEAVERLANDFDFRFVFVGGGDLEDELRRRVARGNWSGQVVVLGWQNYAAVQAILAESHVFVLPSYAEGCPNALLEAMAHGLPAICTAVGAIPDSIQDGMNGFLVPVADGQAVAGAMQKYLASPDLVRDHSQVTLRIVELIHDRVKNCSQIVSSFD